MQEVRYRRGKQKNWSALGQILFVQTPLSNDPGWLLMDESDGKTVDQIETSTLTYQESKESLLRSKMVDEMRESSIYDAQSRRFTGVPGFENVLIHQGNV